jgi:hypothetical protein
VLQQRVVDWAIAVPDCQCATFTLMRLSLSFIYPCLV